jgi:hypothetical protein
MLRLSVGVALLAGCGAAGLGEDGSVLLSLPARAGGVTLEVGGEVVEPAAPRAVDRGESIRLGGEALELRPGLVAHVVDADGTIEWREPGVDVAADSLLVDAHEDVARGLADTLGAEVAPAPDGMWRLLGDELVAAVAGLDEPDGLVEVHLVETDASTMTPAFDVTGSETRVLAPTFSRARPLGVSPDLVGLYRCGDGWVLVNAAGAFWQWDSCNTPVRADRSALRDDCVAAGDER